MVTVRPFNRGAILPSRHSEQSMDRTTDVPERALFRAAEVCAIAKVQPYVLRSWEGEFSRLGTTQGGGRVRVYRRADVELVLEIKRLLYEEGLTLGAARRRLENENESNSSGDEPSIDELVGKDARQRIDEVKRGLRSILDLLSAHGESERRLLDATPKLTPKTQRTSTSKTSRKRQRVVVAKRKRRET